MNLTIVSIILLVCFGMFVWAMNNDDNNRGGLA